MTEEYTNPPRRRKPTKPVVLTDDLVSRFWGSVAKAGDDECWEWTGGKIREGYGRIWSGETDYRAIRVSYAVAYGDVPTDKLVLHSCDNPSCVNPRHLRLGTAQENTDDAKARLRHKYGETCYRHKMTEAQAREAHARYATGRYSLQAVADSLGVPVGCVSALIEGKSWRHLGLPIIRRDLRGEAVSASKLTAEKVREIRRLHAETRPSGRDLARQFGVTESVIRRIVKREAWKHVK